MSAEHEEQILDAFLDELLGGHAPPDLRARILDACQPGVAAPNREEFRQAAGLWAATEAMPVAPPVQYAAEPAPPPVQGPEILRVAARRRWNRRTTPAWLSVAVAASLLAVMVSVGWYVAQRSLLRQVPPVAADPGVRGPLASEPGSGQSAIPSAARDAGPPVSRPLHPDGRVPRTPAAPSEAAVAHVRPAAPEAPATAAGPAAGPPAVVRKPSPDAEIIAFVNDVLKQRWREHGVTPAPPADDRQWCERVHERLIGRFPSADETQAFLQSKASDRRARLVEQLLAGDEYAEHWSRVWAAVLIDGDRSRSSPAARSHEQRLAAYLREAIRDDRPYDQVVFQLLAAAGDAEPDSDAHNPAVHFLVHYSGERALAATDRVARVFLGRQLVCARCHDHPASGGDQSEFWELNAFFRQMTVARDPQTGRLQLVDRDFQGETGVAKDAEIFYRRADGQPKIAYPALLGRSIPHSGLVADVNRRQELAKILVASAEFRGAVVNRVWAQLFGYGFTQPVDDMGPHNPPSHPHLLERLSEELAARDFQLDSLIRWAVLSEAFGLSGRPTAESWMDAPESGARPLFARCYEPPRDPVPLDKMLLAAVNSPRSSGTNQTGTLARRLALGPASGPLAIIDTQGTAELAGPKWLDLLARSQLRPEHKIQHLFLAVLDRDPDGREVMAAKLLLADRLNDSAAVREIWQMLLSQQRAAESLRP